ncbi:hypothetical protein NDU88_001186 [Pleurodeles waltl]|uniref:Helix-turn-helix domain-containing protein n=1 Tax=Pleurodeles waltl TaxID=8319 RepID=A0AAV7MLY6_PLEWA|nr:hypothetical protein NDU88_001186 [Pleurodeles waltl]
MGSKFSPSYANLFMRWLEETWLWGPGAACWHTYILYWGRYIDDCFMLWTGDETSLQEFCNYLNANEVNIEFTCKYSATHLEFLDVELYVEGDKIESRLYRKPTACNTLLHATSAHPRHQIEAIPLGEMIRARRNCSKAEEFGKQIRDMGQRFIARGYSETLIHKSMRKVWKIPRRQTLDLGTSRKKDKAHNRDHKIRIVLDYTENSKK